MCILHFNIDTPRGKFVLGPARYGDLCNIMICAIIIIKHIHDEVGILTIIIGDRVLL